MEKQSSTYMLNVNPLVKADRNDYTKVGQAAGFLMSYINTADKVMALFFEGRWYRPRLPLLYAFLECLLSRN